MSLYEQGDFIEVNFDPTVGHEPQKRRPALVVSCGDFNNKLSSLTIVCPITSNGANRHPLHIELPEDAPVTGFVCIEQLRAIDLNSARRQAISLDASADRETMAHVLEVIGAIFNI